MPTIPDSMRPMHALAALALAALATACGGGGGDVQAPYNPGWVALDAPASGSTYSGVCETLYLSGTAFISPTWSHCCSGSASDSGVTVTWTNATSGQTLQASQWVEECTLFWVKLVCTNHWNAEIPLMLGDNRITITASDPSGNTGQQTLTVTHSAHSHVISGQVTDQLGAGLAGVNLAIAGDTVSGSRYTGSSGQFSWSCIPDGAYTVTPSSTIAYVFVPPLLTVQVCGADVSGQSFVAQAYHVSGTVTQPDGSPDSTAVIALNGPGSSASVLTDSQGRYDLSLPDGAYTLTATELFWTTAVFFPASRSVQVDGADVPGQGFARTQ